MAWVAGSVLVAGAGFAAIYTQVARSDRGSHLRCVLVALGFLLASRPATGQLADYYRGTVVNDEFTGQPTELELFIYVRTDSSTIGWMRVSKPLGGSGVTAVVARDLDSLYFITVTTTSDTIIWASPQRTGTLEGRYWIKGPNFAGQGGRWRLLPQPRVSSAALLLLAVSVGGFCVLLLAALSSAQYRRWWAWRAKHMSVGSDDRQKLGGVRGWLAWFVLGQSLLATGLMVTVREAADLFGGTWMLGATVDGMRPLLFIEAAAHFFQLFGIVLGLILNLATLAVSADVLGVDARTRCSLRRRGHHCWLWPG